MSRIGRNQRSFGEVFFLEIWVGGPSLKWIFGRIMEVVIFLMGLIWFKIGGISKMGKAKICAIVDVGVFFGHF